MILNAIIPDQCVLRAMASLLSEGAHTYRPGKVHVNNTSEQGKTQEGAYTLAELASVPLRTLHEGQHIWIVPIDASNRHGSILTHAGNLTNEMTYRLTEKEIEYWIATVRLVPSETVNEWSRGIRYRWGVIVRLQDACEAAQAIWPRWLDRLRDARYSNDEH